MNLLKSNTFVLLHIYYKKKIKTHEVFELNMKKIFPKVLYILINNRINLKNIFFLPKPLYNINNITIVISYELLYHVLNSWKKF